MTTQGRMLRSKTIEIDTPKGELTHVDVCQDEETGIILIRVNKLTTDESGKPTVVRDNHYFHKSIDALEFMKGMYNSREWRL